MRRNRPDQGAWIGGRRRQASSVIAQRWHLGNRRRPVPRGHPLVHRTRIALTIQSVNLDSPRDRNTVRNVIEFRRGTQALPWDSARLVQTVVVVIDGLSLTEHFLAARSEGFAVLLGDETTPDLGIWGPDPPAETEAPEGFLPVLTCGCTVYGCGGSYARITFESEVVVWSEFHNEGTDEPVYTGPFVFDRQQYERARAAFAR